MITNRTGRRWIALALLCAVPACENPPETLGPDNHVEVTNLVGHFQLTADNIQNVSTVMTFKWQNPGQYADIQHLSFIPHGTALLIIKDAADSVRYDGELLYELDDRDRGHRGARGVDGHVQPRRERGADQRDPRRGLRAGLSGRRATAPPPPSPRS